MNSALYCIQKAVGAEKQYAGMSETAHFPPAPVTL